MRAASTRSPSLRDGRVLLRPEQRRLAWLNALVGTAVLASYAWGFLARPDAMGALWGGVPEALRPAYTANMFLAAAGYFLFTAFFLFGMPAEGSPIAGRYGLPLVTVLYGLVLVPSALWLPLTVALLASPSRALWWLIRIDLWAVAVGSLGLLAALLRLRRTPWRWGRLFAVAGLVPFCLQTVVLDAWVWPAFFTLPVAR